MFSKLLPSNKRLIKLVLILSLAAGLTYCGSSPTEQINQALDRRKEGMIKKDIDIYMSAVSRSYDDGKNSYADIRKKMQDFFSVFDKIELQIEDRSFYISGKDAKVVEKYILSFSFPAGTQTGKAEQLFIMRKEEDGWRIVNGLGNQ